MRPSTFQQILGAASLAPSLLHGTVNAAFSVARPGGVKNVVVTKDNTLNGTYLDSQSKIKYVQLSQEANSTDSGSLLLRFVDSQADVGGEEQELNAYITGLDADNKVVFVQADGSLVYPSSGGSEVPVPIRQDVAVPVAGTLVMTLPMALHSGRIYFARGRLRFFMVRTANGDGLVQPSVANLQDPSAGVDWGFVELTYTDEHVLYANLSFVDFVGLVLGLCLSVKDGSGTQTARGLAADAVPAICSGMEEQASRDGRGWNRMCVATAAGTLVRVLSPSTYTAVAPGDFEDYWSAYVDDVWSRYRRSALTVKTQSRAGDVDCGVSGDVLECGSGDNRCYAKPTSSDIWGCNGGPFARQRGDDTVHVAVMPRLCAAFVRSTLLLEGGDVQPSLDASHYYSVDVTDHYSRLVHELELDGKGYAFPYDDVNPDGDEDASGVVASGAPDTLTVYIGGSPP